MKKVDTQKSSTPKAYTIPHTKQAREIQAKTVARDIQKRLPKPVKIF